MVSLYKLATVEEQALNWESALDGYRRGIAVLGLMINRRQNPDLSKGEKAFLQGKAEVARLMKLADADWDRFLVEADDELPNLLTQRCTLYAAAGDLPETERAAEALASMERSDAVDQYNAACGYSLCVGILRRVNGVAEQTRSEGEYLAAALYSLKRAVDLGFEDLELMKSDPDLECLRETSAYQAWVETIGHENPDTGKGISSIELETSR